MTRDAILPINEMFPPDAGGAYRRELVYWGEHGPVILRPPGVSPFASKPSQPLGWLRTVRRQVEATLAMLPAARRVDLSVVDDVYTMRATLKIVVVDADSVHLNTTLVTMEDY